MAAIGIPAWSAEIGASRLSAARTAHEAAVYRLYGHLVSTLPDDIRLFCFLDGKTGRAGSPTGTTGSDIVILAEGTAAVILTVREGTSRLPSATRSVRPGWDGPALFFPELEAGEILLDHLLGVAAESAHGSGGISGFIKSVFSSPIRQTSPDVRTLAVYPDMDRPDDFDFQDQGLFFLFKNDLVVLTALILAALHHFRERSASEDLVTAEVIKSLCLYLDRPTGAGIPSRPTLVTRRGKREYPLPF